MIEVITLRSLLPEVFVGMEESERIRTSSIWEVAEVEFRRGCRVCLQAESGCGKSSLLSYIYGARTDYRGQILFDGKDVRDFTVGRWCELRTRSLALLPQEMRVFPELTVMQNIMLKNSLTGFKTPAEIEAMLERLGVADKRDTLMGRLSIGQQQRVAIVRTLCQPFDFIFLDEPVSHLDEANNAIVAALVDEEASRLGAGVVSTSVGNHLLLHNPQYINL